MIGLVRSYMVQLDHLASGEIILDSAGYAEILKFQRVPKMEPS